MNNRLKDESLDELFDAILTLENKEECYSFLLGAVLCDEICSVLKSEKQTVIIGGQKQFRLALSSLLRRYGEKQVVTLSDEAVANSTALGAVSVFET